MSIATSLGELEHRVRDDLAALCLPPANWVVPRAPVNGQPVHDVVVIGGGMCGLVAGFALIGAGIRNIRMFDRSPAGFEGPWLTYARMETLRSPKQLTGPAYGFGSLTFRAWFTAQFGADAWAALDKIPRPMWMHYLRWYRRVLDLPVENEVEVLRIIPEGDLFRLTLDGAGRREDSVLARRVVMATGRDGTGHPNIPDFAATLPKRFWAHSSEEIDFAALRGKRVVVVGVGASAVDNAAEALEAGASEVRQLARRRRMPTVNKLMGIGSYGFTAGFPALGDAWRWRIMHYSAETQTPAPRGSTLRVSRHANAYFHFDAAIEGTEAADGEVTIHIAGGKRLRTDYLILGTGFLVEPLARRELDPYAGSIALWRDRYVPPAGLENAQLGLFPYLAADFSFQERGEGEAPWLSRIHCFNYGASVSLGKTSGDIPGISEGAGWLARELAARFYAEDIEKHWNILQAYDTPELRGDEWTASELPEGTAEEASSRLQRRGVA
jgi:cation diffusion facilitator CzcD-associated flavoprotein CzcO